MLCWKPNYLDIDLNRFGLINVEFQTGFQTHLKLEALRLTLQELFPGPRLRCLDAVNVDLSHWKTKQQQLFLLDFYINLHVFACCIHASRKRRYKDTHMQGKQERDSWGQGSASRGRGLG